MKRKKNPIVSLEMRVFPYAMVLPNLLIFTLFIIVPVVYGFGISFTNWKGIGSAEFVGFANYVKLFHDVKFWQAMWRTLVYSVLCLPFVLIIPLYLANMVIKEIRARGVFRAIFYWPSMLSFIVVGISFRFLFSDTTGVINFLIEQMGFGKVSFLTNNIGAMAILILATIWSRTGFLMVVYMSGLQSIPQSYYEAAEVDGAKPLQKFLKITLPLLKPTMFLVVILTLIDLFKSYGLVIQLTKGGPGTATTFAVQYIFQQAFDKLNLGYASALSIILMLILATFTVVQFRLNKGGAIDD